MRSALASATAGECAGAFGGGQARRSRGGSSHPRVHRREAAIDAATAEPPGASRVNDRFFLRAAGLFSMAAGKPVTKARPVVPRIGEKWRENSDDHPSARTALRGTTGGVQGVLTEGRARARRSTGRPCPRHRGSGSEAPIGEAAAHRHSRSRAVYGLPARQRRIGRAGDSAVSSGGGECRPETAPGARAPLDA